MKQIDFDFEKLKEDKRSKVEAFLESSREKIAELIRKGYKTEEILKLLNRALRDESFRRQYDVEIMSINGENAKRARKWINNLRKEITSTEKRGGKTGKSKAGDNKADASKQEPKSGADDKPELPESIFED